MPRSVTLGDLHRQGKLVEIGCSACNLVTYEKPDTLSLKPNIEVPLIARWWRCRSCGASNSPESNPIWVRPDARVILGD